MDVYSRNVNDNSMQSNLPYPFTAPPSLPYLQQTHCVEKQLLELNYQQDVQNFKYNNILNSLDLDVNYSFSSKDDLEITNKVLLYGTLWELSEHNYTVKFWINNHPTCIVEIVKVADCYIRQIVSAETNYTCDSPEYLLALSSIGTLANILSVDNGPDFMNRVKHMEKFYNLLISSMLYLKSTEAAILKREILCCIYFASFNKNALYRFRFNAQLYEVLKQCLKSTSFGEVIDMSLFVLKNIISSMGRGESANHVIRMFPVNELRYLATTADTTLQQFINKIINKIEWLHRKIYSDKFRNTDQTQKMHANKMDMIKHIISTTSNLSTPSSVHGVDRKQSKSKKHLRQYCSTNTSNKKQKILPVKRNASNMPKKLIDRSVSCFSLERRDKNLQKQNGKTKITVSESSKNAINMNTDEKARVKIKSLKATKDINESNSESVICKIETTALKEELKGINREIVRAIESLETVSNFRNDDFELKSGTTVSKIKSEFVFSAKGDYVEQSSGTEIVKINRREMSIQVDPSWWKAQRLLHLQNSVNCISIAPELSPAIPMLFSPPKVDVSTMTTDLVDFQTTTTSNVSTQSLAQIGSHPLIIKRSVSTSSNNTTKDIIMQTEQIIQNPLRQRASLINRRIESIYNLTKHTELEEILISVFDAIKSSISEIFHKNFPDELTAVSCIRAETRCKPIKGKRIRYGHKIRSNIVKKKTIFYKQCLKHIQNKMLNIMYINLSYGIKQSTCLIHPYVRTSKDRLPILKNLSTCATQPPIIRRFYYKQRNSNCRIEFENLHEFSYKFPKYFGNFLLSAKASKLSRKLKNRGKKMFSPSRSKLPAICKEMSEPNCRDLKKQCTNNSLQHGQHQNGSNEH